MMGLAKTGRTSAMGNATQPSRQIRHTAAGSAFFFQAEDGIRDATVTGVQTCALPICLELGQFVGDERPMVDLMLDQMEKHTAHRLRSEERRVGKECRSRWSPYQ